MRSFGLWCTSEQTVEQTVELPVIWNAMALMWRLCNASSLYFVRIDFTHVKYALAPLPWNRDEIVIIRMEISIAKRWLAIISGHDVIWYHFMLTDHEFVLEKCVQSKQSLIESCPHFSSNSSGK